MKKMPEFIVHVSVELADSMVEEKLRYTTNKENQTYTIGGSRNPQQGQLRHVWNCTRAISRILYRAIGEIMLAKEGKPKEKNPTEETRQLVLERDHYRCVRCGRDVRYTPFGYSIHHRRLRSHPYAEMHSSPNLITLCGSGTTGCHGWVHENVKEAERLGLIVSGFARPENIPVQTWDGLKTI